MKLSDIFGQDQTVAAFRRLIENDTLAGSYLLEGAESVGKASLARAIAQAAACRNPVSHPFDACGGCQPCRLADSPSGNPEIIHILPAGEQTQIWQFWNREGRAAGILDQTLQYAAVFGRKRFYIIEQADTLTNAAANSLLKVLEESPPYAHFILLTTHAGRIIPTILSRCQRYRLLSVSQAALVDYLMDRYSCGRESAETLAALSEGRTGRAITLAQEGHEPEWITAIVELTIGAISAKTPEIGLKLADDFRQIANKSRKSEEKSSRSADEKGVSATERNGEDGALNQSVAPPDKLTRSSLSAAMNWVAAVLHDILLLRLQEDNLPIIYRSYRERLIQAAGLRSPQFYRDSLELLVSAQRMLPSNVNVKLLTDTLFLHLTSGSPQPDAFNYSSY